MKISYGRCSDTPHVSFSWSSVVNQSPPITEGSRRPSCLVVLRRFIGDFWSWILAVGHDICQIIQMLEFYGFFIKIFLTLVYLFQIRSVQQSAKALRLSAKEWRLDSKLKDDTKKSNFCDLISYISYNSPIKFSSWLKMIQILFVLEMVPEYLLFYSSNIFRFYKILPTDGADSKQKHEAFARLLCFETQPWS